MPWLRASIWATPFFQIVGTDSWSQSITPSGDKTPAITPPLFTCCASLPTYPATARSCITPFFQLNAWVRPEAVVLEPTTCPDRKSTRLNSSHGYISYAVFCFKKKTSIGAVLRPAGTDISDRPAAVGAVGV